MSNSFHKDAQVVDGIHIVQSYEFADATARNAAGSYVAADIGKVAKQTDTLEWYVLTATTPTWKSLTASGGTVTHASTTGQTANDHHNEAHTVASHSDTTATGAELNELTDGSVTTLHSHSGGGGTDTIACCPFGAKSDSLGSFLIANGKSSDADDSTKPKTRQPIGVAGTLTKLVYKTKEGTSSTQMKIHINGSVEETVTLSSINANFGGVETISVPVAAGDYAEIEWDASDKPGECTMYFIEEPS